MFLDQSLVESATTGEVVDKASVLIDKALRKAEILAKNGGQVKDGEGSFGGGTYQERIYRDVGDNELARRRGMFGAGEERRILEQDLIWVGKDRLAVTYLTDGSRVVEVYDQSLDRMLRFDPKGENAEGVRGVIERMEVNLSK